MTQNDALLEPLVGYNELYKALHLKYTEEAFDELTAKGAVDVAANKTTVSEYKRKIIEAEKAEKALSKLKNLKIFTVVLCVLLVAAGIITLFAAINEHLPLWTGIVAICAAVALTALFIYLIVKKINPQIKERAAILENLRAEADKLLNEAWAQMASLNTLYDWDIPQSLVSKAVPEIKLNDNFDEEKFTKLREKYGFRSNDDLTRSTLFCQSGSIHGNPFLVLKDLKQSWIQQRYDGSITIHWTTTVRTKQGVRTVHHTQILSASIHKPKPVYDTDTYLVYGNEAAPNLTFSRTPSGATGLNEKQLKRKVEKNAKLLDKKSRKAISAGENYTRLGNDEFETLFGGTDRDNEVEYRMLFTPLAQNNLLKLIKTPLPYGDDFSIQKIKKLNFLRTEHAQGFDYEVDPIKFVSYDYEAARENFIKINTEYFKSLYFDLAPLASIPLYSQHKPREFIYDRPYASNVSCYEHESIANSFQKDLLKPPHAATPSIIKTRLIEKSDDADSVSITAYAFRAERRVSYIQRFGGDGMMHSVPVVWLEYIPIERQTRMAVQKKRSSRLDFNVNSAKPEFKDLLSKYSDGGVCLYERGVFAMLTGARFTADAVKKLNAVYGGVADAFKPSAEQLARIILEETVLRDRSNNPETDANELLKDDGAETLEVQVGADEIDNDEAAVTNDD